MDKVDSIEIKDEEIVVNEEVEGKVETQKEEKKDVKRKGEIKMKFQEKFKNQLDTEVQAWIEKIDEELCKSIKSKQIDNGSKRRLFKTFKKIIV